ncbi:MAG: tetratricopeptide repeat protein [Saprospiraceae bacterium]
MRIGRLLFVLLAILSSFTLVAQSAKGEKVKGWETRIDTLLADQSLRYAAILDILRPIRSSDTLMTYLQTEASKQGNKSAESFAVNSLGVLYRNKSQYDTALYFNQLAEKLAEENKDTLSIIVARNSQGVVLRRANRIIEALDLHQGALELAKKVKDPDFGTLRAIAISHTSKGKIHMTLDQLEAAEVEFRQSLEVEIRNDNTFGMAINYATLGNIYELRDELTRSREVYTKAIGLNKELNSDLGLAICYTGLSRVLFKMENLAEAERYAREALPLALKRGDANYVVNAQLQLAQVLLEQGEIREASEYLNQGLTTSKERGLLDRQARALFLLAQLEEKRGNDNPALVAYRDAHAIEGEILNEKNQRYVTAVEARYASDKREIEIEALAKENALVRERERRNLRLALAIIVGLTLLAILLGMLYRQKRLVLQRDLAQLEQQRLASQMNPHFLFNGLNSIKSSLISGENKTAINLLDKFAHLMRRILSSSIDEEVSLREELNSSRMYVSIENSRFSDAIDFIVEVDESIDQDLQTAPPLVLQPFLENALLHGLRNKEGYKQLHLKVSSPPNSDGLEISIKDNGVGRAVAQEITARRAIKRESVGIDITQRRLEHFARQHGRDASFRILDLKDERNEALGTEVILCLE